MLDFRMDTFLAVCRHRNYTRAAEELNITQPAVTQHIQYLQSYYGVKLFSYQNKRLALTEEGGSPALFSIGCTRNILSVSHRRKVSTAPFPFST